MPGLLSLAIAVSGIAYIWAAITDRRPLVYLLKPGTMLLILVLALSGVAGNQTPSYAWAIVAGLCLSLVGDIFLMLPRERLAAGLVAFLLAHLCYIWALWSHTPTGFSTAELAPAIAVALFAIAMFRRLATGLRAQNQSYLLAPVALYILVISVLVWRAAAALLYADVVPFAPMRVLMAALLFYVSDAALAWDKFVQPLAGRHVVVMGCYFGAQYLFALSAT